MGRQAVHFAMGLSGLSCLLELFGMFMCYHKLSFTSAGFFKAFDLEIFLLSGKMEFANSDACGFIRTFAPPETLAMCEDLAGNHDLMDLSHRFCAPAIDALFKQACQGVSMAYALGLAITIFTLVNMVMQGIATFMLYHYLYKKAQKKYREVSLILACIGTCIVALCLMVYMPAVSLQLDSITVTPGANFVLAPSTGIGISKGYMIMWLAVLVQIVQIILYRYGRISDENRMVEQKMQEQFEAELAYGTGGGGGGYGGQPGPGGDPYGGNYAPQSYDMGMSGNSYGGGYPPMGGGVPQSGGFQSFPGSQQYASPPPPMPMSGQQWQQPGSQQMQPQYGQQMPTPGYGF